MATSRSIQKFAITGGMLCVCGRKEKKRRLGKMLVDNEK
jgi:hypothetical protein